VNKGGGGGKSGKQKRKKVQRCSLFWFKERKKEMEENAKVIRPRKSRDQEKMKWGRNRGDKPWKR